MICQPLSCSVILYSPLCHGRFLAEDYDKDVNLEYELHFERESPISQPALILCCHMPLCPNLGWPYSLACLGLPPS